MLFFPIDMPFNNYLNDKIDKSELKLSSIEYTYSNAHCVQA